MSSTPTTEGVSEHVIDVFERVFADLTNQRVFEQRFSLQARLYERPDDVSLQALLSIADREWAKRNGGAA